MNLSKRHKPSPEWPPSCNSAACPRIDRPLRRWASHARGLRAPPWSRGFPRAFRIQSRGQRSPQVGAKISNGWIVGHHFSRMVGPHANSLLRGQEIKFSRLKNKLTVAPPVDRSPELGPVVVVDPTKIYGGGVLLGLIRDNLGMPVALKVDGHVEASIDVGLPRTVFITQNQTVPLANSFRSSSAAGLDLPRTNRN